MTIQLERRLSARKTLGQLGHIGPVDGATVLNVSEGGLGFHAVPPVKESRLVPFWFSANSNLIAGCGELVWIDIPELTVPAKDAEIPVLQPTPRPWPGSQPIARISSQRYLGETAAAVTGAASPLTTAIAAREVTGTPAGIGATASAGPPIRAI